MPAHVRSFALTASVFASALTAQVAPGAAVVASKAAFAGPTALQLVDPLGVITSITGASPIVAGTGQFDGARALVVADDGFLFAGLGVDNSAGTLPQPLDVQALLLTGNVVTAEFALATLMQVPPGEIWTIADLKERTDGSLLVLATQIVHSPNPMPNSAVFVVTRAGAVQALPTVGLTAGGPLGIADLGDRYVLAIEQNFFVRSLQLLALSTTGAPAFSIAQFTSFGSFQGIELDVAGDLVFAGAIGGSRATVHRIAPIAGATVVDVGSGPAGALAVHIEPGSGVVSSLLFSSTGLDLERCDSVLGGSSPWATGLLADPLAVAVRGNAHAYGRALPNVMPTLGSQGHVPSVGNAAFTLRIGEPQGQPAAAFVFGGVGRANIPTAFGSVLVDPTFGLSVFGFTPVPPGAPGLFPLPIPNAPGLRGLAFDLQAMVVPTAAPALLSNALELVVQ